MRAIEEIPARYVVGIDLGTTNSAVAFVDLEGESVSGSAIEIFRIPQGVAPNAVEEREVLPSFFARTSAAPTLPWDDAEKRRDFSLKGRGATNPKDGKFGVVGTLARDCSATEPDSFASSAKSWLCHSGVDRTAPILPWSSSPSEETSSKRWSPVEISSFYLGHIRSAWNARFPDFPLETQDVVLTIPASFDETARALTLEAAKTAGIPRVALVEEPQAAFYSWIARRENDWDETVKPGQKILAIDVGGGTTDFALIYALAREEGEGSEVRAKSAKFYRVAVGDHLVLGGDNLDLALCQYIEGKILEKRREPLTSRERALLLKEAREAKERFLGEDKGQSSVRRFVLPGSGSKLLSGSVAIELERAEVEKLLIDGFFPRVESTSRPIRTRSGVREIGLPYAADPAITKHLASFLAAHKDAGRDLERAGALGGLRQTRSAEGAPEVDLVLFNGGAFESPKLRARVLESLTEWQNGVAPIELRNENLYLAVARGAAYYGLVLRGRGTRVGASLARTYYVGVEPGGGANSNGKPKAVCLLPAQSEPGDEIVLEKTLELTVDRPVAFPIFVSSVRATDAPGDLIEIEPNETRELAPIRTALKTRSKTKKESGTIRARLVAKPTEIGTIELFLQEVLPEGAKPGSRASRWALQFDARGGTRSDWVAGDSSLEREGAIDESLIERAREVLRATFGSDKELSGLDRVKPRDLFRKVCESLGVSKGEIPAIALRRLAETTLDLTSGRRISSAIEARWLNWQGFALRPGFGAATDDWRVERAWKTIAGKLAWKTPETVAQYWILWRRIASGLTAGRQLTLAEPILANLRDLRKALVEGRGRGPDLDFASSEGAEIWRALGALELLPLERKEEIGETILDVARKKKLRAVRPALIWALGRVGARTLFRAPLDRTLPSAVANRWALRLLADLETPGVEGALDDYFALAQLTRASSDSSFDVPLETRERVAAFLAKRGAEETTLAALSRSGGGLDASARVFGEELPLGLRWD